MTSKVLVTGAAGFIGSAVVRLLSREGWDVIALDGLLDGLYPSQEKKERFDNLSSLVGVTPLQMDLRDGDLNELPSDIEFVINEAAMPGLGPSWSNFDLYSGCNLTSVARLIEASARWPLTRFIQISTSSVYGKHAVGDETQPLLPVSPYGVTKLAAENLVFAHFRDRGFPVSVLRYFSVYGPGQRPDMAYRKFIAAAIAGTPITLFGSGEQSRSNTFVDDVARATVSSLTRSEAGEVYNIAGGQERTINEALGIIRDLAGRDLRIESQPAARGDQDRTWGDASKATAVLGLSAAVSLEEGLSRQFEWQQARGI
jgi:nucleoside-diphosphate-sugar epimerase